MIYLKSILIGAAAFIVTVVGLSGVATFAMVRYPQLASRFFPRQSFDLQWGGYYYVDFPLQYILAIGVVAFIIGFAWMVRRRPA